ncbi:MAG: cell division protein FtsA [Flavobacteriales bacterium]
MSQEKIIVGLDIGTTKIVALVGKQNEHGKIEILGMGHAPSVGVHRGVVTHILQTTESIRKAIADAENASGIDIRVVNVGIAGQHIRSYQHRGIYTRTNADDIITNRDVENLIENMHKLAMPPGEEIIHVLPQEYIIDNEIGHKDPVGALGARLEANFHVITGQVSAAKNILKCVHMAGLEMEKLILEPLASSEAVLLNEEKEAGVALVDIGGGTTDLAIFYDGIIRHTAVIPFGGNIITEDIKNGCNLVKDTAEKLKVHHGSALALPGMENTIITIPGIAGRAPKQISKQTLAGIIHARMEEIFEYVDYELRTSGYKDRLSAGIVMTGGGSMMKHSPQLMSLVTGKDTRVGLPHKHIAGDFAKRIANPVFATGVGLVMMGVEKPRTELSDVYSEPQKKQQEHVRGAEKPRMGTYFQRLINKGLGFLEDDEKEL